MPIIIPDSVANSHEPTQEEIHAQAVQDMQRQRFSPSFEGSEADIAFQQGQITEDEYLREKDWHQRRVDLYHEGARRRLEVQHEQNARVREDLTRINDTAQDALVQELRQRYFSVPGASEAAFQAALPQLLEERRRQVAIYGGTGDSRGLSEDDLARARDRRHLRSIL